MPIAYDPEWGMDAGRLVVAMSGGVDSSVAAALAVDAGFDVIGVTLNLAAASSRPDKKSCCGGGDIGDAVAVAAKLKIKHYVIDASDVFKREVIDPFKVDYNAGRTPVPCIACNETVKFRDLTILARQLNADALVTGHYAVIKETRDYRQLYRGVEPGRDQSYFLYSLSRAQLDFARFPIGAQRKREVRALAEHYDLPVAHKPDSQDICFVPDGDYKSVVANGEEAAGDIVDTAGAIVGSHAGVSRFTVGQRRGVGIGGKRDPLYVVSIKPELAQIVVGPREALAVRSLVTANLNWLGSPLLGQGRAVSAQVRSTVRPSSAWVTAEGQGGRIVFASPEYAVAPGQACVLYEDNQVLGGGIIASTTPAIQRLESQSSSHLME